MCTFKKLQLSIQFAGENDLIGTIESNKESQWEKYSGMPSDFITEVFHAPTEEALLYCFRSYVENESDEASWAGDPKDLCKYYEYCHIMLVLVNSDFPLISIERRVHPHKQFVEAGFNNMLEEINKIERKRCAGDDVM